MAGHGIIKATTSEIAEEIARFVVMAGCIQEGETGFSRSVDLFDAGYLDSLGVVRLIAFIEERYAIELGAAELTDQRFTTIDGMAEILAGVPGIAGA
jgi:acyl carrier protein